jgi:hypothetical protein
MEIIITLTELFFTWELYSPLQMIEVKWGKVSHITQAISSKSRALV